MGLKQLQRKFWHLVFYPAYLIEIYIRWLDDK